MIEGADEDPTTWLQADRKDILIEDPLWDAWESAVGNTMHTLFSPDTTLWVLRPGEWTTTITDGILSYHRKALDFQIHTAPPTTPVRVLQTDADTWTIQWNHDAQSLSYPWSIPDDPDPSLIRIVETLRGNDVEAITIQALPSAPQD